METYLTHMSSKMLVRYWIALFYSWMASLSWSTWSGCCGYHESTYTAFIQFTERKRKSSVTKLFWHLVRPQFTPKSFIVRERKKVLRSRQNSATKWWQTDPQHNLSLVELKIDVRVEPFLLQSSRENIRKKNRWCGFLTLRCVVFSYCCLTDCC